MLDTRTPPVTVHQIVRYLGDRHRSYQLAARYWQRLALDCADPDDAARYNQHMFGYSREAGFVREMLYHLKHNQVSSWRIGTKENNP